MSCLNGLAAKMLWHQIAIEQWMEKSVKTAFKCGTKTNMGLENNSVVDWKPTTSSTKHLAQSGSMLHMKTSMSPHSARTQEVFFKEKILYLQSIQFVADKYYSIIPVGAWKNNTLFAEYLVGISLCRNQTRVHRKPAKCSLKICLLLSLQNQCQYTKPI